MRIVSFSIQDKKFAIDIQKIDKVVKIENVVPVPKSPSVVLGAIEISNELICLVQLADLIKLPKKNLDCKKAIVVKKDNFKVALAVESVSSIFTVDDKSSIEVNDELKQFSLNSVSKVVKIADEIILVLDVDNLLNEIRFLKE